jgi:tetratricopeptide (TPR) repeat protein
VPLLEDQVLRDALVRWGGITVADPFQVREAVARVGGAAPADTRAAREIAREVGAGRYLRGEVARRGDSLRVRAGLYDSNTDALLSDRTTWLDAQATGLEHALQALADSLVLRGLGGVPRVSSGSSTRSLPALQAFARGQRAIERWDLEAAGTDFEAAVGYDPGYAQAELWRALSRRWSGEPPATWRSAATLAVARSGQLSSRDRGVARALVALADDQDDLACRTWEELTRADAYDFVAWFGWADCLHRDDVVVRDGRSPSRWRFRTSHHAALRAYQHAFALLPSIHRALRGRGDRTIRGIFKTDSRQIRVGRALPPDTGHFAARMGWAADTLVYIPFPVLEVMQARPWTAPEVSAMARAVHLQREMFHTTAAAWVAASPQSAIAQEALAEALELLNDPGALEVLRHARSLATAPQDRLELATAEVQLRVRRALPGDTAGLRAAVNLADSILQGETPGETREPFILATLASLRGRPLLAAQYARRPEVSQLWQVPRPLAETAGPLVIYAILGAPGDSLAPLQRRAEAIIARNVELEERAPSRLRWLALAASLAWPDHILPYIDELAGKGDFVIDAMSALRKGDTLKARGILEAAARARLAIGNEGVTLDAFPALAALHTSVGRRDQALRMGEASLSLYGAGPEALDDPLRAGALIRSVVQAAELSALAGDTAGARRWARAGVILGSGADSLLQPTIGRAVALAD